MGVWTRQQVSKAVFMWEEGKTATEIAKRISKSRNAVIGKLNRLGIKKPNAAANKDPIQDQAMKDPPGSTDNVKKENDSQQIKVEDQKLTLLFLNEKTCRWPIGDPSAKNFWFCGKPAQLNKRYCAQHSELAFQPNPVKKERSELQARVIGRPYTMVRKK